MTPLPASLGGSGSFAAWTLQDARFVKSWDSGTGAALLGGRWNTIGTAVVYAAIDPATAILEVAVHKGFKVLNTVPHHLHSFAIADPARVHVVQPDAVPNPNWLRPTAINADQQEFGTALLAAHPFVLLPSAVSRHSWNLLVNAVTAKPFMRDASFDRLALDPRLRIQPS